MSLLSEDLARRINPERSRSFSPQAFAEGLARLENEASRVERSAGTGVQERTLRISVIGTNGKGSTAFALEQCLRAGLSGMASPRTGLFTSPHLLHFSERIRMDGQPTSSDILDSEFLRLQSETHPDLLANLTYFELLTLLAFRLFLSRGLRIQIFEAGLGGRLDATRIARAAVVVLTHIGMDHTSLLGHTRQQILAEKLGILTDRCEILYVPDRSLLLRCREILDRTRSNVRIIVPPHEPLPARRVTYSEKANQFARFIYEDLRRRGASAASPSAEFQPLPATFFPQNPPGRMEIRRNQERSLVFDNAHNPSAVHRLLQDTFAAYDPVRNSVGIVFALMPDRSTSSLRRVFRLFPVRAIVQLCASDFAPPDSAFAHLHTGSGNPDVDAHDLWRSLSEGPLAECNLILFLGSHRLYDLFDRVSREARAVRVSQTQ